MLAEYLEAQVLTAAPHRLHLMLVDAAIRSLRQGLAALDARDWLALDAAMNRARGCVAELISGVRPDVAPELAERQKTLWLFVYRCAVLGELLRDQKQLADALKILERHRETWLELQERLRSTATETTTVPEPHAQSWFG